MRNKDQEIPEAEVIDAPDLTDPVALEKFATLQFMKLQEDDEFTRQWRGFMDTHPTAKECVEVLEMFEWLALTPEQERRLTVCAQEILQRVREGSMGEDLAQAIARYLFVKPGDVQALVNLVCLPNLDPRRAELAWLLIQRRHLTAITDEMWKQIHQQGCVPEARAEAGSRMVLGTPTMEFRATSAGVVVPVEGDAKQFELDLVAAVLASLERGDPGSDDR